MNSYINFVSFDNRALTTVKVSETARMLFCWNVKNRPKYETYKQPGWFLLIDWLIDQYNICDIFSSSYCQYYKHLSVTHFHMKNFLSEA